MRYLASHERAVRGTFDFPIALYYVDTTHPRYEMPFHWHMEHELIFVLQGTLHLSVNGEPFTLHQGDGVFIEDGSIHGGTPENCIYECIVFDLERFLPLASKCGQTLQGVRSNGSQLNELLPANSNAARILQKLFQAMECEAAGYEFTTTGLLWELLGEIIAPHLHAPNAAQPVHQISQAEAVKKVLRCIRSDYAEPLTLEMLAKQANLDPKYLCCIFRRITGRTPIDYLNYYRIECAAELLCLSNQSITDIALQCGFGDVSYFSRAFRRLKNQTPSEYRKAHEQ